MKRSKRELKTFIVCGLLGALAEYFGVYSGAWTYANPSLLNIPVWLIVIWGIAAVFVGRVYVFFKD